MQELASLRAETAHLRADREKLQTQTFTQDGKLDHLQRSLARARTDHESALARVQRAADGEKKVLQEELAERERRLAALSADVEFQKNELREARELAIKKEQVVREPFSAAAGVNGDSGDGFVSPRRPRVVKGSGVKSPESKSRVGAGAFGRGDRVGGVGTKKRKREERMVTPEPPQLPVVAAAAPVAVLEEVNEAEINSLVLERVLKERSSWAASDERFQVPNALPFFYLNHSYFVWNGRLIVAYERRPWVSDGRWNRMFFRTGRKILFDASTRHLNTINP
jgi:hypothetical protein